MKNNSIYKLLIIVTSLALIFLFVRQYQKQNVDVDVVQNNQSEIINADTQNIGWKKYHNDEYKFDIEYPENLIVNKILPDDEAVTMPPIVWDYAIDFKQDDDFSVILVNIYNISKIASVDNWLEVNNNFLSERQSTNGGEVSESWVIEREIKVDNLDATVVFQKNINELNSISKHTRKVIVVRGNDLYEITTRFSEDEKHEKVWSSLKF